MFRCLNPSSNDDVLSIVDPIGPTDSVRAFAEMSIKRGEGSNLLTRSQAPDWP
jgi:hypothetical protein